MRPLVNQLAIVDQRHEKGNDDERCPWRLVFDERDTPNVHLGVNPKIGGFDPPKWMVISWKSL